MKKRALINCVLVIATGTMLTSCGIFRGTTKISRNSTIYQWIDNKGNDIDKLVKKIPADGDTAIGATVTEQSGYLLIKPTNAKAYPADKDFTLREDMGVPMGYRTDNGKALFYPESLDTTKVKKVFRYTEVKTGLQAMTVLLKFRAEVPADVVPRIPPMVETGSSFGFAYGVKKTWNSYNSSKNIWGKNVTTFAVSAGPMLGVSATDLKAATNAPGLAGDRKSAVLAYGGFVMLGTGPINIGYALGADRVLGYGASKWVYGGKLWHGLIVGLNLITF